MANHYGDRTHCANNHEFTPENTRWRKDGGRVCRQCKREREAKRKARLDADPEYRARRLLSDRLSKRRARGSALAEEGDELVAKYDDKKTAVQKMLAPKPEAMPSWSRMWEYMDEHRTPCFERPEDFIDYDDPRYPEEATGRPMPTAFEARLLCTTSDGAPCPLLELCGKFAAQNKEEAGVWGGKRYLGGKVYNG
jgi:hypothetical protein